MDEFLLEVHGLVIGCAGQPQVAVPAFRIGLGGRCLITGPSGSGKTVFLRVLLGQAPVGWVLAGEFRVHTAGEYRVLDYRRYRLEPWLDRNTAVVFQDAIHSLHPYRSVEEQCPGGPAAYATLNLDPNQLLSRACRAARGDPDAALSPLAGRYPRDCSGGECQRLSLLFPLIQRERRLVVLDEPLTDIDTISQRSVRRAIGPLLCDPGRAVILVSHQTDWLAPLSMDHYRVAESAGEGPHRLLAQGRGPAPAAAAAPMPVPAAASPGPAVLRLRLHAPYGLGGEGGFRLWPVAELVLRAGESLGLIGESGSGKSSLLRAMAGLFPARAYRGTLDVELDCGGGELEPFMGLPRRRRYRHLQFVSQDSSGSLFGSERVGRHLNWIRRHLGVGPAAFWAQADEWAEALRLYAGAARRARFLDLPHGALSMGQKRRYGLLRAFLLLDVFGPDAARRPKVLLLDEISRGLDGDALERLLEVLAQFRARYNTAILAVSHDLGFVRRLCGGLRMLYQGALLPSVIRSADLAVLDPAGAPVAPRLNPYYDFFFDAEEVPPDLVVPSQERQRVPIGRYGGCLVRRHIICPGAQADAPGCVHRALQASPTPGMIGLCQ